MFFLSCSKITMTLEDMENQLLLPILGDMDPSDIKLSIKEEAVEVELRKGISGNAKLSYWVEAFSKTSDVIYHSSPFGFVSLSLTLTLIMSWNLFSFD